MAKRRGNNEGTVFQDKNGDWWAQLPPDEQGKRPKRRANTQKEAQAKLRQLQQDRARGLNIADSQQTLGQFLETWLNEVVAKTWKASTLESYREVCRLYITPDLGNYRLSQLRAPHVQQWLNALGERVANGTVRNAYRRLRTALGLAVRWRLVAENVAALVDLPAGHSRQPVALTPEQAQRLLDTVAGHRLEALYVLALRLGLREGELLGLLWADVDLEVGELRVSGQMQEIGGKPVRTTPKTKKSTRALWLDHDLIGALRDHQRNQREEKRLDGVGWKEHGLIFASEAGTPISQRNLLRQFKGLLKRAQLPHIRFHDLRHTAGSLMLSEGAHITDVSEVLGHSSPAVTANIYAHSYEAGRRRAVEATGKVLRRKVR